MTTTTTVLENNTETTFQGQNLSVLNTLGNLGDLQGQSIMQNLVSQFIQDDFKLELEHLEKENSEIAVLLHTMTTCTELKAKTYSILEDVMAENTLRIVELKHLLQGDK